MAQVASILRGSERSEGDLRQFFQMQVLFWLLAATDGHAKNFSIFLTARGSYRLTPGYDVLSMLPYVGRAAGQIDKQKLRMAMAVRSKNAHFRHVDITGPRLLEAARRLGLGDSARGWIHELLEHSDRAVWQVTELVESRGGSANAEALITGHRLLLRALERSLDTSPSKVPPSSSFTSERPEMATAKDFLPALQAFGQTVHAKFAAHVDGEPEDQIRAPFEHLMDAAGSALGLAVTAVGETRLTAANARPDYGITVGQLLCGYAELKAPGKGADTAAFSGHDRKQWEKLRDLPNVLYGDGREFALYRLGERIAMVRLEGDPRSTGSSAASSEDARQLLALLNDFLRWQPLVPGSARQLAQFLAPLCRLLRDDVVEALRQKAPGVMAAAQDWRNYLFPGAEDEQFADAYAQTVTFALLLARSNGSDTLFLDKAVESLTHANSLLARALAVLTDPLVKSHLSSSLGLLQRVINAVPTGTMSGGRRDPWLNFYEDFLAEYDPELRRNAGAYYTPVEVVQAQVRIVDELLRDRMRKPLGFATGGVNVLDPAVGTGTYLLGIVEHALERVAEQEGPGSVPARADVLGSSLYGFELMVGPYAVSSLRLTRMLQQYGGHLPGDGVQIMLSNTLESPYEKIPELPLLYQQIGFEHKRAKRVKETVPVLVCIGNPPYDRHEAATADNKAMTGGWVRWGEAKDGKDAVLEDFIAPVKRAGSGGDLKNLYNLYVYFWRWALWKTFEHELATGPGIVSFITASSFLEGEAFIGMREHMRRLCDEIWVIDLGGEGRGTRKDDNVFAIQTPVCITVAVRYGSGDKSTPAAVHYTRVEGTRQQKIETLERLQTLGEMQFDPAPLGWHKPFKPAGRGDFFDWPLLTDLMPWQTSGCQLKRTWPIGTDEEVLDRRWSALLKSQDRAAAFKETRDRTVNSRVTSFAGDAMLPGLATLPQNSPSPELRRYGYRSFDRRYVLADNRLGDYWRATLWQSWSARQVYLISMFSIPFGPGPALAASAAVVDMHSFRGSFGGRDVLPLYRDVAAQQPNLHPQLLVLLAQHFGWPISADEVAAYLYAVLAQPAFTARFHDELASKALHVPLTADAALFARAVALGGELLFLHTYGERLAEGRQWPVPTVKSLKAVSGGALPEKFRYDETRQVIVVGDGEFGPVPPSVWEYEVSGLKVVQSWLGYRMRVRTGKKSSPLDDINPKEWGSEYTSEFLRLLNLLTRTLALHPLQATLLDEIVAGSLIAADALGPVPEQYRKAPTLGHSGELEV